MATTTPQTDRLPLGRVGLVVDARAADLQARALKGVPSAVAALARLRRGAGKKPGALLDILEFTLSEEFVVRNSDIDATIDENAAHAALTLFALHQQSQRERMHRRGHGLGSALRGLKEQGDDLPPEPVRRRFRVLGTAEQFDELSYHLRGVVQLLRTKAIPLDYGLLADQITDWQRPGGPARVRLRWGREFYRTTRHTADDGDASGVGTDTAASGD